ncbi:hypothetical protein BDZ94DRAFT_1316177 [Collybia nuda]|nr:hypothetical protein BDZ94DRAFT_1316177 [Collybia nuda]
MVQSWIYVHNNKDAWALRVFVLGLVSLDLAETACTTQLVHHYLISHFGDTNALKSSTNIISADFTITGITFFVVHLFFANRIWKLGKSWYFPAIISFMSTAMLALGISAVFEQKTGLIEFADFQQHHIMIELSLFHGLSALIDILITVSLSWLLSPAQSGYKSTRTVLQRLLAFTITRGILVCLVQIGHILMYVLDSRNLLFWISLHLILTKIYVLTTLVTLNSRASLRDQLQEIDLGDFHISFAPSTSSTRDDAEALRFSESTKAARITICSQLGRTNDPASSADFSQTLDKSHR